jgi:trk system potassium uptake protein TrkA
MKKQALIVGLGQFGNAVARALAERNVEVLAVDAAQDRVRAIAPHVTEAACFDATDAEALARASPERREVCICAIGDEAKEASIICTALLKQMGAKRVIARANDDLHARILHLVGADQIVNPEREFGERFANRVLHEGIVGELPLGDDLLITEFRAPQSFVGHTLADLQLPRRHGVTVVAMRPAGAASILLPDPRRPLSETDILVVVARQGAVARLLDRS